MSPTDLGMSQAAAAKPKAPRTPRSRRVPGSLYAFVVTLICVFLAGVILAPSSPKLFVAEAAVSLAESAEHTDAELLDRLRKTIVSDKTLRQVLRELGPPANASPERTKDWPPYSEVQRLQKAVRIEPASGEATGGRGVKVLVVDRDRDRALKTVERLAHAVSDAQGTPQGGGNAVDPQMRERLMELRAVEKDARKALDTFLHEQFQTVDESTDQDGGLPDGVSSKKKPSLIQAGRRGGVAWAAPRTAITREQRFILAAYGDAPARRELNPAWLDLQRELEAKQAERNQLLERLTPLHPQVQKIDVEMSDIRRQQYKVPRYLDTENASSSSPTPNSPTTPKIDTPDGGPAETPGGATSHPAVTPPDSTPDVNPPATHTPGGSDGSSASPRWTADPQKRAVVVAQYEELQKNLQRARRQLEEAELLATRMEATSPAIGTESSQVRVIASPRIVESYGGAPSGTALALVGMLSLAVGGVVALSVRRATPAAEVLSSADDVSSALNLPVVGDLRGKGSGAGKSPARRRGQLGCYLVRAAELLLAVFALTFLLVAMLDSPFLSEALANPLAAVSQILHRLTNLF